MSKRKKDPSNAAKGPTAEELRSLELVLEMAIVCSCSCETFEHSRDCWVYSARDHIARVQTFLDRSRVTA